MKATIRSFKSPIGEILVGIANTGVVLCATGHSGPELLEECKARGVEFSNDSTPEQDALAERVEKALERYFAGELSALLGIPLLPLGTEFQKLIWNSLRTVQGGDVASYKAVAELAEKPDAVRAVGSACRTNPLHLFVPCHRIVSIDGELSGFRGGLNVKEWLLSFEQESSQEEPLSLMA